MPFNVIRPPEHLRFEHTHFKLSLKCTTNMFGDEASTSNAEAFDDI